MGNITLRTNDDEDAVIAELLIATGEKTASGAIKKAIQMYKGQQSELHRLQMELSKAQNLNAKYRSSITAFKEAQSALFSIEK